MNGFRQDGRRLIWEREHETVQIEPCGVDSLRVRATRQPAIRDDLPGALLDPGRGRATIEIGTEEAAIRAGALLAQVTAGGQIAFCDAGSGAELLAEDPGHFVSPAARCFRAIAGEMFHVQAGFWATTASDSTAWASTSTAAWTKRAA